MVTPHPFGWGKANKYDLVSPLCVHCHYRVHHGNKAADSELSEKYKALGQTIFEQNHTREEFIAIFGRNYL